MARGGKNVRMPSGMGGLMRYFDEYQSKIQFTPATVVVICAIVMLIIILLHTFAGSILGV